MQCAAITQVKLDFCCICYWDHANRNSITMHVIIIINPQRMYEGYGSHSVCVCLYTSFASPNCGVIRFLMAFETHDLCGFRRKRFVR